MNAQLPHPNPSQLGSNSDPLRTAIRQAVLQDEETAMRSLITLARLSPDARERISGQAARLVDAVRESDSLGIMEKFLTEYGLSTKEGVALMCLAEALLRVPDAETIDALIQDKIVPADWGKHLGRSSSSLVNASTWALMLTGRVLGGDDDEEHHGLVDTLHGVVRRLGEPVVRVAVAQAMRELGQQFVLGQSIEEASKRATDMEEKGYTYSYDMLGEAARTDADARRYHIAYSDAITALAPFCTNADIRKNPGISVKLSALHPRYEFGQREAVLRHLAPRAASLASLAKSANMGFNIDAEEADRLDLSLDVIETLLADPALEEWGGIGIVVQAYGPRARFVLDWLYDRAAHHDRQIMVRLVKGAYWDTEIKRAQVMGLQGFPVFTRKPNTDVSFIACARKLLSMTDRIYPQFATHNAHTAAAILDMAEECAVSTELFEFQRLHGMGEALHDAVKARAATPCRIYAPVGAHEDLLAYLVRRLLENGANSSFVNRIADPDVASAEIAADPFSEVENLLSSGALSKPPTAIRAPEALFAPERVAAKGWDITDPLTIATLDDARAPFKEHQWFAHPMLGAPMLGAARAASLNTSHQTEIRNPALHGDRVGVVSSATPDQIDAAFTDAAAAQPAWNAKPIAARAACPDRTAALHE